MHKLRRAPKALIGFTEGKTKKIKRAHCLRANNGILLEGELQGGGYRARGSKELAPTPTKINYCGESVDKSKIPPSPQLEDGGKA